MRAAYLLRRNLDDSGNRRLHPHKGGVSLVHSPQIDLWVARPRLKFGVAPVPAEEDAQTAFPGEGIAHPRRGQTIFGNDDERSILFQEPDWHPATFARAMPDRLYDDCVSSSVRRTGKANTKRPHPQRVSNPPSRSLDPGLLGSRHSSYANRWPSVWLRAPSDSRIHAGLRKPVARPLGTRSARKCSAPRILRCRVW